jgi:hypothetical protein
MLNDDTAALKAHLKDLHANLAGNDVADEELQGLLRQLDGDIVTLLDKRAAGAAGAAVTGEPSESITSALAERSQEITARFAAQHPRLEPALRELGNILSSMGI